MGGGGGGGGGGGAGGGATPCVFCSRVSMTNDDSHHDKWARSVGERSDQSMKYASVRIQVRT